MLRPLFDNVLVIEIEQERMVGSVMLPDIAGGDMKLGKIMGTGPHCYQVAIGDIVVFGPHAGMLYSINGTAFLLMREPEIKGVCEAPADN